MGRTDRSCFLRRELGDGKRRNRYVMDYRAGSSRSLELPEGDYRITLMNGAAGLNVGIAED
jgi:hypothetical protein